MEWIKKNWFTVLAIALVFFIARGSNGCNPKPGKSDTVTVKRVDTIQVLQPPIVIPQYIPVPGNSQAPVIIPPSYQPSGDYEALLRQYNELAQKHLTVNSYNDSIVLKDTLGKKVGIVNITDQVSENKITSRKPSYQLQFPTIKETITTTITNEKPPNTQVYFGGSLSASPTGVHGQAADGGLLIKTKKDQIYSVKGGVINVGGKVVPQIGVGAYWKIKF